MIKKSIIATTVLVIVLAAVALVFSSYTNHNSDTNSSNLEEQQDLSDNSSTSNTNTSDNTNSQTKVSPEEAKKVAKKSKIISSAEAKKIAQKNIEEPGAIAGTPKLTKKDGKYIYAVPVIKGGKYMGELNMDAHVGKCIGGGGGAP